MAPLRDAMPYVVDSSLRRVHAVISARARRQHARSSFDIFRRRMEMLMFRHVSMPLPPDADDYLR